MHSSARPIARPRGLRGQREHRGGQWARSARQVLGWLFDCPCGAGTAPACYRGFLEKLPVRAQLLGMAWCDRTAVSEKCKCIQSCGGRRITTALCRESSMPIFKSSVHSREARDRRDAVQAARRSCTAGTAPVGARLLSANIPDARQRKKSKGFCNCHSNC